MTHDELPINEFPYELQELAKNLTVPMDYSEIFNTDTSNMIMLYGVVCEHDTGYLCEHRLMFILNKVNELVL